MIVVDLQSPRGHKSLNQFIIISLLSEETSTVIIDESHLNNNIASNFDIIKLNNIFTNSSSDVQGYKSYINHFLNYYKVIKASLKKRREKVLFLSYNPMSHLFLFCILKIFRVNIFVIEHNSVPNVTFNSNIKDRVKLLIFKFCSILVHNLVLEGFITRYLSDNFGIQSNTLVHPCLGPDLSNSGAFSFFDNNNPVIFSPSGSTPDYVNKFIANNTVSIGYNFIAKSSTTIKSKDWKGCVIFQDKFDSYYELINFSDAIIIHNDFCNRVSGVFYESLKFSKIIFLNESNFACFVANKYPNVFVYSDLNDLLELIKNKMHHKAVLFDYIKHNENFKNEIGLLFK